MRQGEENVIHRQANPGHNNVQVGHVGGHLTIVQVTQRLGRPRRAPASDKQREALRLLDQLPRRDGVHAFMRREFGTSLVLDLDGRQVYRLLRYLSVVLGAGQRIDARE